MLLTVFTPTFNRAYIIENLYKSLQRQTCKDFEWLVVDDGSSDNTSDLFLNWQMEESFPVRYIKKENGGKHRAINLGLDEAKGKLFFIVDSDDYLAEDAIKCIKKQYEIIKNDKCFAGLCGMRAYPDGRRIGGEVPFETLDCISFDYWFKHNITGDSAEVFKTDIFRQFPFPEIDGEKFCPEAVVWYRIARAGYKIRYFNKKIYFCDYLPDGLTAKITKLRINSPLGAMLTYKELYEAKVNKKWTTKSGINYWRFYFHCSKNKRLDWRPSCIYAIPGYIFYLKDCIGKK